MSKKLQNHMATRALVMVLMGISLAGGCILAASSYLYGREAAIDCTYVSGTPNFTQQIDLENFTETLQTDGVVPKDGQKPRRGFPLTYATQLRCFNDQSTLGYSFNGGAVSAKSVSGQFSLWDFVADVAIWATLLAAGAVVSVILRGKGKHA